jgi:hypothetical protein
LLVAACSGSTENVDEAVVSDLSPTDIAGEWLEAVVAGRAAEATQLVEPTGLAVIAAVENNLRSGELVGLLDEGLSADLESEYWLRFAEGFAAFSGAPLSELTVGAEVAVGLDGQTAVELSSDSSTGHVFLRLADSGWQVDFAATIGPALVGPLGEYLASALSGDNAEAVAAAYREAVVPGLDAALALDGVNSALLFEAEYIRQLSATP